MSAAKRVRESTDDPGDAEAPPAVAAAEAEEPEEQEGEEPSLLERLKEVVEVETADLGPTRRMLTVRIPAETIREELDEQYGELMRDALVPGFRKGRAPRALVEKRFGRDVRQQVKTQLVSNGYLAALERTGLRAIGDPLIYTDKDGERGLAVHEAVDALELSEDGPLTFRCEVEIIPEFELPALEGIPLKRPVVTITDADVDAHVRRLQMLRGHYQPVEGGRVEPDDLVVGSVRVLEGEAVLREEANVELAARPQSLEGIPLPGLGDALKGARSGDVVRIEATVPPEHAEWGGRSVVVEISIHDIKRLVLPEIDEDFVRHFGFDTEQQLREWIRSDLESRLGERIREGLRNQVAHYLVENTSLELPETLSARQTDRVVVRRLIELRRQGVPEAEIRKHLDELRTTARDEAIRQLKFELIMEKLAETLEVSVRDEEVNALIHAIAARYNQRFDRVRDELARGEGLEILYRQIRDEKILDRLIEQAKITEVEAPAEKEKPKRKPKGSAKKVSPEGQAAGTKRTTRSRKKKSGEGGE